MKKVFSCFFFALMIAVICPLFLLPILVSVLILTV